ncbi:hypothetical protein BV20DRAFT_45942 [Pilatotrama ljubarskyi]|nr:hypothetical protein BV20DRAFT_45942 [Pilatotrama ljubarskyi]
MHIQLSDVLPRKSPGAASIPYTDANEGAISRPSRALRCPRSRGHAAALHPAPLFLRRRPPRTSIVVYAGPPPVTTPRGMAPRACSITASAICRTSMIHMTCRHCATPTCPRTCRASCFGMMPARTAKSALLSPWSLILPYVACAPQPREPATWHAHIAPARPLDARDTSRTHQLRGTPPLPPESQPVPIQPGARYYFSRLDGGEPHAHTPPLSVPSHSEQFRWTFDPPSTRSTTTSDR